MKKITLTLIALLCAILLVNETQAQFSRRGGRGGPSMGVRSIGGSFGWYKPSLKYWKTESAMASWSSTFKGALLSNFYLDFYVANPVFVRIGAGYWEERVYEYKSVFQGANISQEFSLKLIPATVAVLSDIPVPSQQVVPYGGLSVSAVTIQQANTTIPSGVVDLPADVQGRTVAVSAIAGVDFRVTDMISVGAELSYIIGNYAQTTNLNTEETVSISGPYISGTFKFALAGGGRKGYGRR